MSLKIVFNGQEYDGVDAMPPDVRKEYEVALETLRKSGGEEILSLLQRGGETHIKATFREIVVNGKKYDSVDAMPPDVRHAYERAMAGLGSGGSGGADSVAPRPRMVQPPPVLEDDAGGAGAGGTNWWRVMLWLAAGGLTAWWLFHRG